MTNTPLAAKETRTFSTNGAATQGGGACTVYPGTIPSALSINVTVDATSKGNPAQYGFLSITPEPGPGSSWMNFFGGQTVANAGVATINSADGSFAIKTQNPANVVVDVYGYWVPSVVQRGTGGNSIVMGDSNTASGFDSAAMGEFTIASGAFSTAMGNGSEATASNSSRRNRRRPVAIDTAPGTSTRISRSAARSHLGRRSCPHRVESMSEHSSDELGNAIVARDGSSNSSKRSRRLRARWRSKRSNS